jgi:uncharacterized delta-60 repeat protein
MMKAFITALVLAAALRLDANTLPEFSLDEEFHFHSTNINEVDDILLLPDGRIAFAGSGSHSVGLIDQNGENETGTFIRGDSKYYSLGMDGERAVIGAGESPSSESVFRLASLAWDPFFNQRAQISGAGRKVLGPLEAGDWIVAGNLTRSGIVTNTGLIRLSRIGEVNPAFNWTDSSGFDLQVATLDGAGRILAGGFATSTGAVQTVWGRWFADGTRDTNYSAEWLTGLAADAQVTAVEHRPGEAGFICAVKYSSGAESISKVVSLDEDGELETGTPEFPVVGGAVYAIAFQYNVMTNYQVLLGGNFNRIGELACTNLAAVSMQGQIASVAAPGEGPNAPVLALEVQPDGKILAGGEFTEWDGTPASGLVRLKGLSATGASHVYWTDSRFKAYEKLGTGIVRVAREGNLDTQLELNVSVEGSSSGPSVNVQVPQSIRFEPGEQSKDVVLNIINDSIVERTEHFLLRLSASDSVVISRAEADLSILDDESPGTVDPNFHPAFSTPFQAIASLPGGKFLLGYSVSGGGPHLMRMNSDGTIDPSFSTNGVPSTNTGAARITQIQPLADGRIYVAGTFLTVSGPGTNLVVRLLENGELDTTFNPKLFPPVGGGAGAPAVFALEPDGKIVVALQNSTSVIRRDQSPLNSFAFRLNPDGSLDQAFSYFPFPPIPVYTLAAQADGKLLVAGSRGFKSGLYRYDTLGQTELAVSTDGAIWDIVLDGETALIGGDFTSVSGTSAGHLARIRLADGMVDMNFLAQTDSRVDHIKVRPDGKIYISGIFTRVNGQDRYRFARLNSDGGLDENYDAGMTFAASPIFELQGDGKVVASLSQTIQSGPVDLTSTNSLVRLEDGPIPGTIQLVEHKIVASDSGGVVRIELERTGGSFGALSAKVETVDGSALAGTSYFGTNFTVSFADGEFGRKQFEIPIIADPLLTGDQTFAVRINSGQHIEEGTVLIRDEQANSPDKNFDLQLAPTNAVIRDFKVAQDGSVLLAGTFDSINSSLVTNIARLSSDLQVDESFSLPLVPNGPVNAMAVRPNGQVLLGGSFTRVGASNWSTLVQLNQDLTYDVPFNTNVRTSLGLVGPITSMDLLPDGKLLVRDSSFRMRRVNTSGVVETSFNPGSANPIGILPNREILAARSPLTLLQTNGTPDLNFTPVQVKFTAGNGGVASSAIQSISVLGDGRILIGGNFTHVNNIFRPRIARLFPDGTLDTNFAAEVGTTAVSGPAKDSVLAITPLPGGDILVGGNFMVSEGEPHALLVRLNENGELRKDFNPDLKGDQVDRIDLLPGGAVLLHGTLATANGINSGALVKLNFAPDNLPPVVQINWPTNNTEFLISDAIPQFQANARAYDPDGFIESMILQVDGTNIQESAETRIDYLDQPANVFPFSEGAHVVTAIAEDDHGLRTTNSVNYTVRSQPMPSPLFIRQMPDGSIAITGYTGTLEQSDDLRTWTPVSGEDSAEFLVSPDQARHFYRAKY